MPVRRSRWRALTHPKIWLRCQQWRYQIGLGVQWWQRPHAPYQPVFVLATARSGSNLLIDYLSRIPGIECHSEVLCTHRPFGISPRQANPEAALKHIQRSLHSLQAPIRGCKLMLNQLADCRLTLDAIDAAFPEAKYLILYRQSLAEQYLSRESALLTDQWVVLDGQERKQPRIPIDPAKLRSFGEATRQAYREILDHAWLPERSVLLSYEELTADPVAWLNGQIGPLLGVSTVAPQTVMRKQNTLPIEERVANYREVASLLASPLCRQHYAWPGDQPSQRAA